MSNNQPTTDQAHDGPSAGDVPVSTAARVELDETITDPAAIRATDEPDERGDFPCCTTPAPVGATVGLDLDAIEAAALADDGWWSVPVLALVAEVRRLTEESERLKRGGAELGRILDRTLTMALDASGRHDVIEEDGDGDWEIVWETLAGLQPRAESAEAEVGTLRAKVAAVEALASKLRDEAAIGRDTHRSHTLRYAVKHFRAALATGEGK